VFRRQLVVPLATVELSFDAPFTLGAGDADVLIQLRDGDVMWQKERLLNIGISRLPDDCDYVAWLDCDIVFSRDDWVSAATHELTRADMCQLYRSVYHLARDASSITHEASIDRYDSLGYASTSGLPWSVASVTNGAGATFKRGHAWCARRELLAAHGLYDRNVIGGGDSLLAHAATGRAEEVIVRHGMTPAHADDYRRWAAPFHKAVSALSYIDGDVFHLWHGELQERQYRKRFEILSSHGYDPDADIALTPGGSWRWNSSKPEMHRMVREYFVQRDEDADGPQRECQLPALEAPNRRRIALRRVSKSAYANGGPSRTQRLSPPPDPPA
jgi:hypothetical protein